MRTIIFTFFLLLLISCSTKDDFFQENLYREILKYQKFNTIPDNTSSAYFIYEISFSKQKDTLLSITVNPFGIQTKNSYGIYKSKTIKTLYIIDSLHYGKKLINIYKKDSIDSYILEGTPPNIDIIYPVYKYKVKGTKLYFLGAKY